MDFIRINRLALPPEEHELAAVVEDNLIMLHLSAQDFRSSADLYLYAHDRKVAGHYDSRRMISWIRIAGRNGAIAASSLYKIMEITKRVNAPTLQSKVDSRARKTATKLFAREFLNIVSVRNSTAHPGEITGTLMERERHRLDQLHVSGAAVFGEGTLIHDSMHALHDHLMFGGSFEGRFVEYELSMRKADILDEVVRRYCEAFRALERQSIASSFELRLQA